MMPDTSKYYVSNYLDSTISVVDMAAPAGDQDDQPARQLRPHRRGHRADRGAPRPVSPNGKYVVTANA